MLHSIMLPICLRSSEGPSTEAEKARQSITDACPLLPPDPRLPGGGAESAGKGTGGGGSVRQRAGGAGI